MPVLGLRFAPKANKIFAFDAIFYSVFLACQYFFLCVTIFAIRYNSKFGMENQDSRLFNSYLTQHLINFTVPSINMETTARLPVNYGYNCFRRFCR